MSRGQKLLRWLENWGKTFLQALVVWFLSNLPILLAAVIAYYRQPQAAQYGILTYIAKNLHAGEAFLYVAAFVAPFFWTLMTYNKKERRLPWLGPHLILALVALVGSTAFFTMIRSLPAMTVPFSTTIGALLYTAGVIVWVKSLRDDSALAERLNLGRSMKEGVEEILGNLGQGGRHA